MKNILLASLLICLTMPLFAQRQQGGGMGRTQEVVVMGQVLDLESGSTLPGAHLTFVHSRDTSRVHRTATDLDGVFYFNLPRGGYILTVTFLGYRPGQMIVEATEETNNLGKITLSITEAMLHEVTVAGRAIVAQQRGDTLQFNAAAFSTNPDASAEDLLRKMPGIVIDASGVRAQGETVQRVLVDGQEFFGSDPNIALRNLPAEMIEQIEVFDQMSDQARLTGFDDGQTIKTINIVTRLDRRSGQFGRVYTGYGDTDRYQAGLTTNIFMDQRRISIIGMTNNINQQNFSSEDLSGFMSTPRGGGTGMGMRGGGGGRSTGGGGTPSINRGDFLTGQQPGDNTTHSLGMNYSDIWGGKANVSASYFFNMSENNTEQFSERQYFFEDGTPQFYSEDNLSSRANQNHRFNARIDYRINDNNTLLITPRFSFQNTESQSFNEALTTLLAGDQLLNESFSGYNRQWDGYSFSNNMTYRLRLNDDGRSLSTGVGLNVNNNEYLYFLDAMSAYYDGPVFVQDFVDQRSDSGTDTYGVNTSIAYTEPVGENSMLQLSYNLSFSNNASDRMTNSWDILRESYSLFENDLSSELTNGYLTNRLGLSYRLRGDKFNFQAELSYQQADLTADQQIPYAVEMDQSFRNVLPMLNFSYNFSRTQSLRLMYRTFTNPPSVNQLQDVVDNTNPLLLSSGNPDLEQSASHFVSARFNSTDVINSRTFFASVFANFSNNYIGTSTLIAQRDTLLPNGYALPRGAQFSQPVNLDGQANVRFSATYGLPLNFIRSNLNFSSGLAYTRTPGLLNGRENISNAYITNGGMTLSSNIGPNVDFTLSYNMNYSMVENAEVPQLDNSYFYHVTGIRFNWIFLNGWVLRNDVSNLFYSGLGEDFNENFWLWNLNIGKKFMTSQQAEITLGVYDLLNQNQSVARVVANNYIEDSRTNVLNRFFMLTLTYNIRNFNLGG